MINIDELLKDVDKLVEEDKSFVEDNVDDLLNNYEKKQKVTADKFSHMQNLKVQALVYSKRSKTQLTQFLIGD